MTERTHSRPGAEVTDCCGLAWTYAHNPKAGTALRDCGCEDCADGLVDAGYSVTVPKGNYSEVDST
jgi:hypothetical protein